ncbi:MAG: PDZ domain-containing protein [Planctomycetota bacterium]|nr:PDZ domain-containing protein [Planctomycetota bacterium]
MQRLLSLAAALAAATFTIQDPGLVPVAPLAPGAPLPPGAAPSDQAWRDQLTDPDFGVRASALDDAANLVTKDPEFRHTIEAWAADRSQGELAWTAYLVLRQADGAQLQLPEEVPSSPFWSPPHGIPEGSYNPFIQAPGLSIPSPFGEGLWDAFGSDPFGLLPEDFDIQLFPSLPDGAAGRSQQLSIGPDGVTIRVEVSGPDGTEVQEFQAESLEALRAESPELFEAGGALEGFDAQQGDSPFGGGLRLLPPDSRLIPSPTGPRKPGTLSPVPVEVGGAVTRTDVLGVMVASSPGDRAQDATDGLLVARVVPGTIAAHVGLEPGDLVIELGGTRVGSAAEVSDVLAKRAADAPVQVRWVDDQGTLESGTWTPR